MKKIIATCIIALIVSSTSLFAQNITIPLDSIQGLLCKKWEVDYAVMGGMKIGRMPGASEISYEFNKDKTFIMTSNDRKEKKKGTWSYDAKEKLIKLTVDGRSNTSIISLKEGEFVMLADTKSATPDDPMEIKLVYKPSAR
jgi:hypothetical protein